MPFIKFPSIPWLCLTYLAILDCGKKSFETHQTPKQEAHPFPAIRNYLLDILHLQVPATSGGCPIRPERDAKCRGDRHTLHADLI